MCTLIVVESSIGSAGSRHPPPAELSQLTHTIAHRIGRYLERQGLLVRDAEQSYLALDESEEDSMNQLQGHSITYRIAVGPHQGRKVFTLQTLPGSEEPFVDNGGRGSRFLAACQRGRQSERTKEARADLPLYHAPCRVRETTLTNEPGQSALRVEDTVSRRHNTCDFRTRGFHCQARCSGAQAQGEPNPVPRSIRAEQQAPSADHTGAAKASAETQHRRTRKKHKPTVRWP